MTLCDDKLVHACGGEGEDRADKIERKVGLGVGVNGLGRAKREQNGAAEDICQHRDGHSEGQNVHEAVCDDFFSGVYVLFAKTDADKRRAADADEKRERRDERDDGTAHADACERLRAVARNIADIHTVYNAVQYADELREHGGNGQGPDEAFNVIRPEVVCELQGKAPPQCSWQT